jgi:ABC-2 type transport system permease protein
MRYHLGVLCAELKRKLIIMVRYPLQSIINVLVAYAMFVLLAGGLKSLADPSPEQLAGALVGYVMWSFATLVLLGAVVPFAQEMSIGLLEQVYLSAFRPLSILTYRALAGIIVELVQCAVLFTLASVTVGIRVSLPIFPIVVVLCLTGIGLYGAGLALSGLTIVYKQIGRAMQLLQLALLFFTGALIPLESLARPVQLVGQLLPLSLGIKAARMLMVSRLSLGQVVQSGTLLYLVLNSSVYLALGVAVFLWADRVARQRGLLGQY